MSMMSIGSKRLESEEMVSTTGFESDELEETLSRISRERQWSEPMLSADENEEQLPSLRSIESFLYRVSRVFQDKRPASEHGQAMDHKMYVRQSERKHELGMR